MVSRSNHERQSMFIRGGAPARRCCGVLPYGFRNECWTYSPLRAKSRRDEPSPHSSSRQGSRWGNNMGFVGKTTKPWRVPGI